MVYALHGLFESHLFWERRGLAAVLDALWEGREGPRVPRRRHRRRELLLRQRARGPVRGSRDAGRGRLRGVGLSCRAGSRSPGRPGDLDGRLRGPPDRLSQRPEAFGAVAAHSAMLLESIPTPAVGARGWHMEAFHKVFGDPIDSALWTASDPLALAQKVDPGDRPCPPLRLRHRGPIRSLRGERGPPPPSRRAAGRPRVRAPSGRPRLRVRADRPRSEPRLPREGARPLTAPAGQDASALRSSRREVARVLEVAPTRRVGPGAALEESSAIAGRRSGVPCVRGTPEPRRRGSESGRAPARAWLRTPSPPARVRGLRGASHRAAREPEPAVPV